MIDEFDKIKDEVKQVIKYSQNIEEPKIDEIMHQWAENKEWLYDAFGEKLIKSIGKVEVKISDEEKEKNFNEFLANFEYHFAPDYNPTFVSYLTDQKKGFYENKVIHKVKAPNGDIIPEGMKLIKTFKYFITNKDKLYKYQTEASMLIQNNKVKGELCMSIHPLDFLSSSENTYNWRSCHSLDGEYRAGNLSYMADGCTFITYIRGEKQDKLPNFPYAIPWNSKKWRMLMFASESHNYLMAGRQYPFNIDDSILRNLKISYANMLAMSNNDWSGWHDDYVNTFEYKTGEDDGDLRYKTLPIRSKFYAINDIVKDPDVPQHYNDLLHSSFYTPMYAWYKKATTKPNFEVGRECKCLKCGEHTIEPGGDSMLCVECNEKNYAECECCGARVRIDMDGDGIYVDSDGGYICQDCYNESYFTCKECGDVLPKECRMYDKITDMDYCQNCYDKLIKLRKEGKKWQYIKLTM